MPWTLQAARRKPSTLGLSDGKLSACPNKPNCVSSQASKQSQQIDPFTYSDIGRRQEVCEILLKLLDEDSALTLATREENYVHAEARAMMFIDDIEFYLPQNEPVVHVRSASRLGRSDFGANRRRVEALRETFLSRL